MCEPTKNGSVSFKETADPSPWCAVGLADWYAVSSADNYRRTIVEGSPKDYRRNNKLECVNALKMRKCVNV